MKAHVCQVCSDPISPGCRYVESSKELERLLARRRRFSNERWHQACYRRTYPEVDRFLSNVRGYDPVKDNPNKLPQPMDLWALLELVE